MLWNMLMTLARRMGVKKLATVNRGFGNVWIRTNYRRSRRRTLTQGINLAEDVSRRKVLPILYKCWQVWKICACVVLQSSNRDRLSYLYAITCWGRGIRNWAPLPRWFKRKPPTYFVFMRSRASVALFVSTFRQMKPKTFGNFEPPGCFQISKY